MTTDRPKQETFLPRNALTGVRLGISVSDSADLGRLGLLETHFRLALAEIARCVLVSGGELTYGGHLEPTGYTAFLVQELHRYSRRDRPLHICLAWQEHQRVPLSKLEEQRASLGLYGDITFLDPDGRRIDAAKDRSEDPVPEADDSVRRKSLTSLRRYMADNTEGRILIGGKREGFQGDFPGLVEEAILALKANQPVYLAGGFGGVTMDILRALGVDDGTWFPRKPDASVPDERLTRSLESLAAIRKGVDWVSKLQNGLDQDENLQLTATHRPSEIAALISLGLGRRFRSVDTG